MSRKRSSCTPHLLVGRFPHSLLEKGMKRSAELSSGLHCSCTSQLTKGVWGCGEETQAGVKNGPAGTKKQQLGQDRLGMSG